MLLTLTTTHTPATDLGYLLHKNPARVQSFTLSFGQAHVFYPEATAERCTAALLLDIDPIGLVRNSRMPEGAMGDQYVNDRPYVASSFLSVAISEVYRSALGGRCPQRPELVETPLPLRAHVPVLPCRGGEQFLRGLFEPLGYQLTVERLALDERFPEWGGSRYFSVTLDATRPLKEVLAHLYVLVPVLDNDKHYWIGRDEVDKLLRHAGDWLASHPLKEEIARRYLNQQKSLARQALERLVVEDSIEDAEESVSSLPVESEQKLERPISLNQRRIEQVIETLRRIGAVSVVDLGCGEGRLLNACLKEKQIDRLVGVDVSLRALEIAEDRLHLDRLPSRVRDKLRLVHGSLTYRDRRLEGFDAATVIEVIEHLDPPRLASFERALFEFARPRAVVMTTPNAEYNVKFESLHAGEMRHPDHRFEWSRTQFEEWARNAAAQYAYDVTFGPIGDEDRIVGAPTQMALFQLRAS